MEHSKQLLAALVDIKVKGPKMKSRGICENAECNKDGTYDYLLRGLVTKWPKYSGDSIFPVPSSISGVTPMDAYIETDQLWAGKYGALRMELLDFLIEQLTLEVGE